MDQDSCRKGNSDNLIKRGSSYGTFNWDLYHDVCGVAMAVDRTYVAERVAKEKGRGPPGVRL